MWNKRVCPLHWQQQQKKCGKRVHKVQHLKYVKYFCRICSDAYVSLVEWIEKLVIHGKKIYTHTRSNKKKPARNKRQAKNVLGLYQCVVQSSQRFSCFFSPPRVLFKLQIYYQHMNWIESTFFFLLSAELCCFFFFHFISTNGTCHLLHGIFFCSHTRLLLLLSSSLWMLLLFVLLRSIECSFGENL